MTIEIKELHIRVSVTAPTSTAAGRFSAAASEDGVGTEAIVAACVEQVMDLLRDRTER